MTDNDKDSGAKRLHERFTELAQYIGCYGNVTFPDEGDPWLNVWLSSWLTQKLDSAAFHQRMCLSLCQSPIEMMFLISLAHIAPRSTLGPEKVITIYDERDRTNAENHPALSKIIIQPQAQVGQYRADFQIEYFNTVFEAYSTQDGVQMQRPVTKKYKVFVECDGHDFHERTKDQAARDRKRDREFQYLGFNVFRFTGSEIWKDPIAPVNEILNFFMKQESQGEK